MKLLIFLIFAMFLQADILKENYVRVDLNSSTPKLLVDFESDNLTKLIPNLDENKNEIISWKELYAKKSDILQIVNSHTKVYFDSFICKKSVYDFKVYRRVHQSYIKVFYNLSCKQPHQKVTIKYDLFFDIDSAQKAFVSLSIKDSKPAILSANKKEVTIKLKKQSTFEAFKNFFIEGVFHIWIGFDHILFLTMLLLPAIYYNKKSIKKALIEIVKVITGFSIAHSITLALSVTKIVEINSNIIEVAIALSVLFTAINNIYPMIVNRVYLLSFFFGLIHGFGFANVLHELMLKNSDFIAMLFGFNLGVETGQLMIVFSIIIPLFLFAKTKYYKRYILQGVSFLTAVISVIWAVERGFGISIIS